MDGFYQDIIILLTILFFGFWVIKKHYDNALEIEQLQIKYKQAVDISKNIRQTSDMKAMQDDLIEFRQSLINIDAKYKIKDEWTTDRLQQLVDIVQSQMSVQDTINTFRAVDV